MIMTDLSLQQKRERTTKIISNILNLNVIPKVIFELMKILDNPNTTAHELNKIISKDQALVTKILSVANSPLYGLQRKVSTIDFAILVLGFKELKSIISVISISDALKNKTDKYLNQKEFMLHSYMVGAASKKIAKDMGFQNSGEAFIAGFLHDIGISIVHRYLHSNFAMIFDLMESQKMTFRDAEVEVNGMTHEEIGSFLLEKWNFPAEICDAVLNHHNPGKSQLSPAMASIISVADYMTQSLKVGELKIDKDYHLDEYTLSKFNFEKELDAEKFAAKYKDLFWEQLEFVRFLN
ncbi:MAG: HDOD domain-containing protein [Ignavibacterium sp.]